MILQARSSEIALADPVRMFRIGRAQRLDVPVQITHDRPPLPCVWAGRQRLPPPLRSSVEPRLYLRRKIEYFLSNGVEVSPRTALSACWASNEGGGF